MKIASDISHLIGNTPLVELRRGDDVRLRVSLAPRLRRYVAEKGSVTKMKDRWEHGMS